jgi:putative aldouronate transport system permease protein
MKNPAAGKRSALFYKKSSYGWRVLTDVKRDPSLYVMLLPVLTFYILFCYKPMYGALIVFFDYIPGLPMFESEFVGFRNFKEFITNRNFLRLIKNTLTISLSSIIFGFPAPIILALLLNELRGRTYSRVVQTVSYMPHFISLVVVCGIIRDFTGNDGIITQILVTIGASEKLALLSQPKFFVPIYVISGIWQSVGYGSIIYLAALTNIDQELYEAAKIDGANKFNQTRYVTLPGITPTIMTMLLLNLGGIMNVGFEKIFLLYNSRIMDVSDVISTFVYRVGLQQFDFSFSTAVGLFNSVINFVILIVANNLSKRLTDNNLF